MTATHDAITICTAAGLSLLAASVADAQTVDRQKFDAYIASPLHKTLLARAVAAIPTEVFQRCPALNSPSSQVTVVRSVTFGADGVPNGGAWWQHLPVSGCGNDTTLNILYEVAPDGAKIDATNTFPGSTRADPTLQRDALLIADFSARRAVKDCKLFQPSNTRFESFGLKTPPMPDPGKDARFRPWWETWTMVGCGQKHDVTLNFIPDATGTKIIEPSGDSVVK